MTTPPLPLAQSAIQPQRPYALEEQQGFKLQKLWLILLRRRTWFGITFGVTLALTGVLSLRDLLVSPEYQGTFRLLVQDPLSDDRGATSQLDQVARMNTSVDTPNLIEVLSSPMLLEPLAKKLELPAKSLNGKVFIGVSRDTDVLNVSLLWNNVNQGRMIIAALAEEYLAYSLKQRQEKLNQGLRFLDTQAPGLQQRVSDLQQELAEFRSRYTLLEPEVQSSRLEIARASLADELRLLSQAQAELQGLRVMVRSGSLISPFQSSQSTASTPANGTTGTGVAASIQSGFAPLLTELTQIEADLANAQSSFKSDSPLVRNLVARRNRLKPLLQRRELDAINSALQVNLLQQAKVKQQMEELAEEFRQNPELIKRYEALQQRLGVARDNLGGYLKSREAFRLEVAQRTVPWQLISSPAFSVIPVKPDLQRNLLNGILLGLVAGSAVAVARDRLDHVYHTTEEVEADLSLPVLAGIPFLPAAENITINELIDSLDSASHFDLRESLRNFFQALKTLRASRTLRIVAVTSTIPSEGKTTSTSLLGKTLADLGMKVLLVDGDLRRMRLHRFMGVDNVRGWSELFTETPPPLDDLYQWATPNLAVLSGGPEVPDPVQLLSSPRCGEVIEEIRDHHAFDLVLFDTPPALDMVDAQLIASHLDGLLMLVSLGGVNRDFPSQVIRKAKASGIDVLGILVNQRIHSPAPVGYGYGYGYGYRNAYKNGYRPDEGLPPGAANSLLRRADKLLKIMKNSSRKD